MRSDGRYSGHRTSTPTRRARRSPSSSGSSFRIRGISASRSMKTGTTTSWIRCSIQTDRSERALARSMPADKCGESDFCNNETVLPEWTTWSRTSPGSSRDLLVRGQAARRRQCENCTLQLHSGDGGHHPRRLQSRDRVTRRRRTSRTSITSASIVSWSDPRSGSGRSTGTPRPAAEDDSGCSVSARANPRSSRAADCPRAVELAGLRRRR